MEERDPKIPKMESVFGDCDPPSVGHDVVELEELLEHILNMLPAYELNKMARYLDTIDCLSEILIQYFVLALQQCRKVV